MTLRIDTHCVAVFTSKSPGRIIREGGSQAWALDPVRARTLPFLACVQNQNHPDRNFADASEAHGAVFLIGRISDVVPSEERGRWRIVIGEYALIHSSENIWRGARNPVKYTTLEELGVDLDKLDWLPVTEVQPIMKQYIALEQKSTESSGVGGVSMSDAKIGLAAYYGVPPENIEIVIRG